MPRIRKDDMVEILSGNDRGKRGRVLKMIPKKDRRNSNSQNQFQSSRTQSLHYPPRNLTHTKMRPRSTQEGLWEDPTGIRQLPGIRR